MPRIAFAVSKSERNEIKRRAGPIPVAIWIRSKLLAGAKLKRELRVEPEQHARVRTIPKVVQRAAHEERPDFASRPEPFPMTPPPGYPGLTPPPVLRFAEDREPPQPERSARPPVYEPESELEEVSDVAGNLSEVRRGEEHQPSLGVDMQVLPDSGRSGGGTGEGDPGDSEDGPAPDRCCSRPQVIDGVCLRCGQGAAEPKVVAEEARRELP